ncbi:MAG: hypothetical protein DWP92_10100 [Armatimonadetes bacterium]|nr:MAG: hypothetical protein DWP92_10100 [Armatimonadota bacterium]
MIGLLVAVVAFLFVAGYFATVPSWLDSISPESRGNERSLQGTGPFLEVIDWSWSPEHGYVTAEGTVKNISTRRLTNVQAVVTYHDSGGRQITYDTSIIEYNPLLPGQTSPFKVYTKHNPLMEKASLAFKELMGGTIPTRSR